MPVRTLRPPNLIRGSRFMPIVDAAGGGRAHFRSESQPFVVGGLRLTSPFSVQLGCNHEHPQPAIILIRPPQALQGLANGRFPGDTVRSQVGKSSGQCFLCQTLK